MTSTASFVSSPTLTIAWPDAGRQAHFQAWLAGISPRFNLATDTLRPASADASFRRYFRIDGQNTQSFIVMDAPPDKENSKPFVKVADIMRSAGLLVPDVLDWHEAYGFMLLTDLGTQTMLEVLNPKDQYAQTGSSITQNLPFFEQATDALIRWQLASKPNILPPYDDALLRRELQLFPDWYIQEHRKHLLTEQQTKTLKSVFDQIIAQNLSSPSVYVHRDFMPRNLMVPYVHLKQAELGVLDFQDAVYGPITYDIASLMRDAFVSWEEDFVMDVTIRYWQKAKKASLPVGEDFGDFYRAVEWMGLQRHLKILGIFARLTLRDGKSKYLADTPRFIAYVRATCNRYTELKPLLRLLDAFEPA